MTDIAHQKSSGYDSGIFFPQLHEFYFTTAGKKIVENCRCIVPNFISLVPDPQKLFEFPEIVKLNMQHGNALFF
jgi:hypothetical protein